MVIVAQSKTPSRLAIALLSICLALAPALHAEPIEALSVKSEWILDQLANPHAMSVDFIEMRGSALLKDPLVVSGHLRRSRDGVLVREVRVPYLETTTITQDKITIARIGKRPRTFLLSRAPELSGLQASFGALLGGDRGQLEQHYRIESSGTRQDWKMVLTPRLTGTASKVPAITLRGHDGELRCIESQPQGNGDVQRTLLGEAARGAENIRDARELVQLCQGNDAA